MTPLAEATLDIIRRYRDPTFAELQRLLAKAGYDTSGDRDIFIADHNIVVWTGMSDAFIDALEELRDAKACHWDPCHWLTYVMDGQMLRLPIAKRPPKGGYKRIHWAPVVLRLGWYTADRQAERDRTRDLLGPPATEPQETP